MAESKRKVVSTVVGKKDNPKDIVQKDTVPQRVHRRFSTLVVLFSALVLCIVVLVFYIAFSKTVITMTVEPEKSEQYVFSYPMSELDAQAVTTTLSDTYEFTELTGGVEETGTATGEVIIYNNYSSDQPLVRTTRLLSSSGVLFRTDETVTVPAGGSLTVPVYADQPGVSGDIGPSTFEIVALWEGLKDQIYAESFEPMTGGILTNAVVSQDFIDKAIKQADQKLKDKALVQLSADVNITNPLSTEDLVITVTEQMVSPQIGEPANTIRVETTGNISGYSFDKRKLADLLTQDTETEISSKKISYSVVDQSGQAYLEGHVKIAGKTNVLDEINVKQLTNKSGEQIRAYLEGFKEIKDVQITFSPFWIKTSSPNSRHIKIIVN